MVVDEPRRPSAPQQQRPRRTYHPPPTTHPILEPQPSPPPSLPPPATAPRPPRRLPEAGMSTTCRREGAKMPGMRQPCPKTRRGAPSRRLPPRPSTRRRQQRKITAHDHAQTVQGATASWWCPRWRPTQQSAPTAAATHPPPRARVMKTRNRWVQSHATPPSTSPPRRKRQQRAPPTRRRRR
ncbi:hypothetical protein BU14_0300s0016 [Porphyra umbilicalis]|uniref:Uncharacterized protein n=1 Tax=Porphyra umbilicalis TaxID=2786 RepID=A0A1X6P028_PORUM|nr:hypothetical protein BU14_0300s0016 [Porphyra umbilicalis]|eukprot:OSX74219.1 hypothetical protein BU14_0300s0016 [Porphyra umbilicalis]